MHDTCFVPFSIFRSRFAFLTAPHISYHSLPCLTLILHGQFLCVFIMPTFITFLALSSRLLFLLHHYGVEEEC